MLVGVREEEEPAMEAHAGASSGGGGRKGRKKKRGGVEEDWSGDLEAIAVEAGMDVEEKEGVEDRKQEHKVEDPIAQGEAGRGGGRKGRKGKKREEDW